jgi:hypothetical protein
MEELRCTGEQKGDTMNKLITSAVTLAAAAGIGLTSMGAASASPVPATSAPKIQTYYGGWHGHSWKIRPSTVYFGGGAGYSAPRARHLLWTSYGQTSARATGQWFQDTCNPNCAKGGYWVSGDFRFYGVFNHAGPGRNFGNAEVTWGKHSSFHLWITSAGNWNWND